MNHRAESLAFAEQFPTPNVAKAIKAAEDGLVTWEQIHGLFQRSLGSAMAEVTR